MDSSWEYIEQAVVDNGQEVVVQFGVLKRLTIKKWYSHETYTRASDLECFRPDIQKPRQMGNAMRDI